MDRWEYFSLKFETGGMIGGILNTENLDCELNMFGEQGWELVSCVSTNSANGKSREVVAILKRRK